MEIFVKVYLFVIMKLKKLSLLSIAWFNIRKSRFLKRYSAHYFYPALAKLFFESLWQIKSSEKKLYITSSRVAADLPITLVLGEGQNGKSSLMAKSRQILPQSNYFNTDYQPMAGRNMPRFYASSQKLYVELPQYFLINESAKQIPYLEQLLLFWESAGDINRVHEIFLTISVESLCTRKFPGEEFWSSLTLILEKLSRPINIYFVITHIDRLRGFSEFFSDLSVEERQHPFGFLFNTEDLLSDQIETQFSTLAKRLQRRMWWRCQSEHILTRRILVAEFPQQFSSLSPLLLDYLKPLIVEIQHRPALQGRGCFLTSTMQQGHIFDLLFDQQEALFTLSEEPSHLPMVIQNKEYFVRGFFQHIGSTNHKLQGKAHFPSINLSNKFWSKLGFVFASMGCIILILLISLWGWTWWHLHEEFNAHQDLAYQILASPYAEQNLQQFVEYEAPLWPKALQRQIGQSNTLHYWLKSSARDFLNKRWQAEVYLPYTQVIVGKFPIDSTSVHELSLEQFNAFYGPQGVLMKFDQRYFQFASIQTLFANQSSMIKLYTYLKMLHSIFYGKSGQPLVAFTVYPDSLAETVKSGSFMVSGVKMNLRHHGLIAGTFSWPNQEADQESGFALEYLHTLPKLEVFQGTWSWLRLFEILHWEAAGSPNDYKVSDMHNEFSLSIEAENNIALLPEIFTHLSIPESL